MRRLGSLQERRTKGMLVDMRPIASGHASDAGIRAHQWEPGTTPKGHPYLEDSDYCGREFNVKFPRMDIPDFVRDELGDVDDIIQFRIDDAMKAFTEDVKSKYKWIGEVGLAGRSAGWLVIEDGSCGYQPSPNDEEFDPKREEEWDEIQKMVADAMSALIADIESPETWKEIIATSKGESVTEAHPDSTSPKEGDSFETGEGTLEVTHVGNDGSVTYFIHRGKDSDGPYTDSAEEWEEITSAGVVEGRAAKPTLSPEGRITAFRKIVDEKQAAKIDGTLVDLFTASGVVQVYDRLSPANQEKFAAMPVRQMAAVAWKMIGGGRNEGLAAAYEDARRESPNIFTDLPQG